MQVFTNVSDLQNALNTVIRAIAVRSSKKTLEGVLLSTDNNELTLTCTDGNLVIQSTIQATVNENGRIVLPGRLFSDFIRKLPLSEVSIKSELGLNTQIKCATSNSRLSGMNPLDFPEMIDIIEGKHISMPQNRLKDMINRVAFSAGTDESRIILTGCLMEISENEMNLVALDGFRLAQHTEKRHFDDHENNSLTRIVIPSRVMNELSKILSDEETPCDIYFNKSHIKIVFSNNVVASPLLVGEYIDYHNIIPNDFRTYALVKTNDISEAIDRASLMAREGKTNILKIQLLENGVVIDEWVSGKEPHVITGLKTEVEYTLRETVAPDGYELTTDTTFIIDKYGVVTATGSKVKDGVILIEDARKGEKPHKKTKDSSNTGDDANAMLWLMLALGASGSLFYVARRRRSAK